MILDRDSISNGLMEELGREAGKQGLFEPLSDAERHAVMERLLAAREADEAV